MFISALVFLCKAGLLARNSFSHCLYLRMYLFCLHFLCLLDIELLLDSLFYSNILSMSFYCFWFPLFWMKSEPLIVFLCCFQEQERTQAEMSQIHVALTPSLVIFINKHFSVCYITLVNFQRAEMAIFDSFAQLLGGRICWPHSVFMPDRRKWFAFM